MALDFDGVNDTVDFSDIAAIDGATEFTIMGWMMVDTLLLNSYFWGKTNGDRTFGFGTRASTDNTAAEVILSSGGSVSQSQSATGMIAASIWRHWAFVYNGAGAGNDDKVKIYRDGVDLGPLTHTATPVAALPAGTGVLAAARNQRDNVFFDCKQDHMKVWLAALTASEVLQEVYTIRPQRETNLLIWAMYDNATTVLDLSGNATLFPGTVTEATVTGGPPNARPSDRAILPNRNSRRIMGRGIRRSPYVSLMNPREF